MSTPASTSSTSIDLSFGKRLPDELYDLQKDPDCVNNLANDLAYHKKVRELRDRMMEMLVEEKDPRALGKAEIFDTYQYLGGRTKGYETWMNKKLAEFEGRPVPEAPVKKKKK